MKTLLFSLLLMATVLSCKKTTTALPVNELPYSMKYMDLADTSIRFSRSAVFDLNGDGAWDIFFGTLLTGDPLNQVDKRQWLVNSSFNSNLPVSASETIPVMGAGDIIPPGNFAGYNWYNASSICLVQKVISMVLPPSWEGGWKSANHQYIPLQVNKNGALYNGWVEVSFSMAEEKLVLHRAALCNEAGRPVQAGK